MNEKENIDLTKEQMNELEHFAQVVSDSNEDEWIKVIQKIINKEKGNKS